MPKYNIIFSIALMSNYKYYSRYYLEKPHVDIAYRRAIFA